MQNKSERKLPELLAPAGHYDALSAAVAAGADAVYFGVGAYNARMNAKNFDGDDLLSALSLCHAHGVKAHITLNTQLYDRELDDALRTVERLYGAGVDALIVADIGLASLIHKYFPELELHASTQMSGHSLRDAEYFASLGFSRIVVAREISRENLRLVCERSPIDVEMFIHGANCVSTSGQCLMSSLIGGRSGNRGECAQPCRMQYNGKYPLSPKDLCLAEHMEEIIDLGVSSLKIEGRMKSPDYVYRVVSVYRRLLDEGRNADRSDINELSRAFSRSGFTDGLFTGIGKKHPNDMLGIRTDDDKATSRKTEVEVPKPSAVKIKKITAVFAENTPSRLTFETDGRCVTVFGNVPETAKNKPMTEEYARSQLSKLGGTNFTAETAEFDISVADGIMLPASALNELRRKAVSALTEIKRTSVTLPCGELFKTEKAEHRKNPIKTAEFLSKEQITDEAKEYFDRIYLPLEEYTDAANGDACGVVLPPTVFDSEVEKVKKQLEDAVKNGAKYAILSNSGQLALIGDLDLIPVAGFRYNINNSLSAASAIDAGAVTVTASPELTLPQIRDIAKTAPTAIISYGRIPVMTTERCIVRAVSGDRCVCKTENVTLTDRTGAKFPIRSLDGCRNIIYNSVPVYMADKFDKIALTGSAAAHFMFTVETPNEVDKIIAAYKNGTPTNDRIRRIK